MPGNCSSAISVEMRGGFFEVFRAASRATGICFSRVIKAQHRSSGEAKVRFMSVEALDEIPLE